jgi:NAD(P)-dependent dehydrogenase (short-subunit alcohol dehydrogenase family)
MPQEAVFITGGTSGIGRATAELLYQRGVRVMVTGSSEESVAAARAELPDEIIIVRADSGSLDDTADAIGRARAEFGGLTGLFLNAGIFSMNPIEAVSEAEWDGLFDVNAKGQFFTLQHALPLLTDGASVVMTVGIGAVRGSVGGGVAAGSRGALLSMVPSFAIELAPRRIRVNALSPGAIDTPILGKSGVPADQLGEIKRGLAAGIPFGRLGAAREVATTAAFLLSTDASYITGEHIVVGGGAGLSL